MTGIRVFIIDDHEVVRRGVWGMLEVLEGIEPVGQAADGAEGLTALAALTPEALPDVLLLDLMMARMDGVQTAREVARRYPSIRVVIMTGFDDAERVQSAISLGAAGYVLKTAGPSEVEAAIRAAARNQLYLDPSVARRLTERLTNPVPSPLTGRENEVLALVGEGLSNQEIASRLHISERTARNHVSAMLAKLSLTSRTQAALYAVRHGITVE